MKTLISAVGSVLGEDYGKNSFNDNPCRPSR